MKFRQFAWILILIVDLGYVAWGAGAAISPDHLLGPSRKGILPAAFEGYTGGSWSQLQNASPLIAGYMIVLYRTYGVYCAVFGLMGSAIAITAFRRGERWAWWTLLAGNTIALLSAIAMDKMANAIGPFELTEYAGLLIVWIALGFTVPFRSRGVRLTRLS